MNPAPSPPLHLPADLPADPARALAFLIDAGRGELPLPGSGRTLARWQQLAEVAAFDLSLAKLFEGHADALAVLSELDGPQPPPGSRWGTWCAEPPGARLRIEAARDGPGGRAGLDGIKPWCSGAAAVTHALVSGWNEAGEPLLAAVEMTAPGVGVTGEGWHAVGMGPSASVDVRFEHAPALLVGGAGAYLARPGFWQGGAGIAACWFGGALGIARRARSCGNPRDVHRQAHLGAIDVALAAAAALLRETAAWIDAHPREDARGVALRVRLAVEHAADRVLHHAARAVGAGPLCRDAGFARAMADLPVYLRQSHAERDLAALGQIACEDQDRDDGEAAWRL